MKKKIVSLMAIMMVGCMLAGCGNDKPVQESEEAVESTGPHPVVLDLVEVTLGEYKGIEVNVAPPEVEQYLVDVMVESTYNDAVTAENGGITNRAVAEGDTANIDYVGKKEGVAFEGGTANGYNLTIGSGRFIDGFEDGLIGVMPGETVDLNLKFPDAYASGELAGAEVVFTVTVNYILPTEEDWQDSVVSAIGIEGVNTIQDLRDYAYDYYYESAVETYNTTVRNDVLNTFVQNCTFDNIPRHYLESYANMANAMLEQGASYYGVDTESFCYNYYGVHLDEFVQNYSEASAKQEIVLLEVAKQENLTVTDEEVEAALATNAAANGFASVEEYLGQNSVETFKSYLICEKALQFMVDNAVIINE